MRTQIKYTKEVEAEEEINPVKVRIRCQSVEFIFADGTVKKAETREHSSYAVIENGKLRFNKVLKFD